MKKKILITGASGFIGSFLVERALKEDLEVWAAVRPQTNRQYLQDERIRFIELDLGNSDRLTEQLEAHREQQGVFHYVIHAAGATKCRRSDDFFRVNARGTERLAYTLLETGCLQPQGRFVFISSLSVYGPSRESDMRPITEDSHKVPDTAYGKSKLQAECALADVPDLNYIILRPTGVYGPRERDYFMMAKSISRHVDFAVGFKPQVLTFIYVEDLVEAAFLALRHGRTGRAYFLTDGKSYTSRVFSDLLQLELGVRGVLHITAPLWVLRQVCRVAAWIAERRGTVPTLNPDKYRIMSQRNWQCDITPARKELGYTPKWPLVRGVKATVAWYKEAGWL